MMAANEPGLLIEALMKRMRGVRKELEEFRKYGSQNKIESARRAELFVMPKREKRA